MKEGLISGIIEKPTFDTKVKQLEAVSEKLADHKDAAAIKKEFGIIDEEDAGFGSPIKAKSGKMDPDSEAFQKAKDLAQRMAREQR